MAALHHMTRPLPRMLPTTGRCLVAAGFIALFGLLAFDAVLVARDSVLCLGVELCCLAPVVVVAAIVLRPGLAELRDVRAWRAALAALPETAHPLGL